MEQKRVPEAAPEWPSVELGIGEKRSFRKGSKSAFNTYLEGETRRDALMGHRHGAWGLLRKVYFEPSRTRIKVTICPTQLELLVSLRAAREWPHSRKSILRAVPRNRQRGAVALPATPFMRPLSGP